MKKQILMMVFLVIGILSGCSLGNTPTSRVEDLLSKYQMLDSDINISYVSLSEDTNIDSDYKDRYEELIRKQYRNMSYEIKEETIDGDGATVTVEIEVMDYQKIIDEYDKDDYTTDEYHKLVLEALEKANDKVVYTLDINVIKDESGNWSVAALNELERRKLLGMNVLNDHIIK